MTKPIRRVGVVGSGVMGSGIAAHMANAGLEVLLLDIVPRDLSDAEKDSPKARNRIAAANLKATAKAKPAAFLHPSRAKLVTVGNIEDDLAKLEGCDLIIEAIIENLKIKRSFFEKLDAVVNDDTVVASNTSGLRIVDMIEGREESFRKNFLVMHFFNPVRYMKLLELVPGPETSDEVMERVVRFGEDMLGKGIVIGKDTPNFVGNRIGVHAMMSTIHQMVEDGLLPEDVDAISGPPMGHPKSASFRTADLVGLDTFAHVAKNCYDALPDDEERDVFKVPSFVDGMVEKRILGNKTRGGFYKKTREGIQTLDLTTLEYRPKAGDADIKKTCKKIGKIDDPAARVRKLVATEGKVGEFAWKVLSKSLAYSARRIGEITDDVDAVDDAMKWGYNWELGPFETWDALGFVETLARMQADGIAVPDAVVKMKDSGATSFYREDGAVFDLAKGEYVPREADPRNAGWEVMTKGNEPVFHIKGGAVAHDLGDGVLGLSFETPYNTIDLGSVDGLWKAAEVAEQDFEALVIFNQGANFCVGANLGSVVMASMNKQWADIEKLVDRYQGATQRLKYAHVPVVGAPFGMTLGGGLELCFGCDAVQAAAETYAGLVEVGVGLIPGGAGTMNMLWRALEGWPEGMQLNVDEVVTQVFKNIAMASVATSAVEAQHKRYFRWSDGVSFDRARHLHEAKLKAAGMAASGYHPPVPRAYRLPGESGIATLSMMADTLVAGGYATEHDGLIAKRLGRVLCGGAGGASREVTESEMLELEKEVFLGLCGEEKSIARMQAMLTTNKPLRN